MKWHSTTISFTKPTQLMETSITSTSEICPNRAFTVKIYYYHPTNAGISTDYSNQPGVNVIQSNSGVETLYETVKYVFGKGSLAKTDWNGRKDIFRTDWQTEILRFEYLSYNVYFKEFAISSTSEGNKAVWFYFDGDYAGGQLFEFTVAPCGICDADNLDQCATQQACTGAGGYWYDNACHVDPETPPDPVCDLAHPELCLTQETCEAITGLHWWSGACHTETIPLRTITVESWDEKNQAHLAGDSVYLNSSYKGQTDSNGFLVIADLPIGTYTLKMTKSGIQDTDLDAVANDSIEVTV